ncbi:MAG: carotenoid biosynthesis protein [Candidatus Helarchaeales archaeon]
MTSAIPPDFWIRVIWIIKDIRAFNPLSITVEIVTYVLTALTFYHAWKTHGLLNACLFFFGSFVYTCGEENFWILAGALPGSIPTYYFNFQTNIFWWLAVPIVAGCSWFILAYGAFFIAETIFPEWSLVKKSILAGLLAMNIDLMVDPIAVRYTFWFWLSPRNANIWLLGIPISNFYGWFLLIFLFSIYWTKISEKEWKPLKKAVIFFAGLLGLLVATIIIIVGVTIPLSALNGLDLTFWSIFGPI